MSDLVAAHLAWQVGDLVQYRMLTRGSVKGVVADIYPDPVHHVCIVMRVTSMQHPQYPKNMELVVAYDDPYLTKRKRYGRAIQAR